MTNNVKLVIDGLSGKAGYLVFALVVLIGVYYIHVGELTGLKGEMSSLNSNIVKLTETILLHAQECKLALHD